MAAKTEKEKMMAGEMYYSFGNELFKERQAARHLLRKYNHDLDPDDHKGRVALLQQLLGSMDMSDPPFIEPPFVCDYGYNITLGAGTYMNFGCCILDCNKVTIGARVLFGPNVQVYAATHPLEGSIRQGTKGPELALPITIGNDVWIGGGAIILPGITIGEHSVVGAGAVVTKDVAPYTVVAGNPATVRRRLQQGEPASAADKAGAS